MKMTRRGIVERKRLKHQRRWNGKRRRMLKEEIIKVYYHACKPRVRQQHVLLSTFFFPYFTEPIILSVGTFFSACESIGLGLKLVFSVFLALDTTTVALDLHWQWTWFVSHWERASMKLNPLAVSFTLSLGQINNSSECKWWLITAANAKVWLSN